jgi:hypothetical protein
VFAIGFPIGFFGSGIFSGLAAYLAEPYPDRAARRGTRVRPRQRAWDRRGRAGRNQRYGGTGRLSDALALAATSYVLCLVALLFLPETRGKHLTG